MFSENHSQRSLSHFERLEDRVLFDGVPDAPSFMPQVDAPSLLPAQVQQLATSSMADASFPRELIILDPAVEDGQQLLQSLMSSNPGSTFEIHLLQPDKDGVQQITELLAKADSDFDASHIVSHGEAGRVALGSTDLSNDNIDL